MRFCEKNSNCDEIDFRKQIAMITNQTRNPDNSFTKGIREVAARDRREAAEVRMEIREVLGNLSRSAYYYRQWGITPHSPIERSGIEIIFRRHQVTQPWGL